MEVASLFATSAGTASAATAAGSVVGPVTAGASGASALGLPAAFGTTSIIPSLSFLQSGMSLASMAGDIFGGASAGRAAAQQLAQQAEEDFLSAKQDELQGKQEQNDINENLLQTIASQRLAFSGAGIDFSFGSPASLERNRTRQAEMQLGTSRDNARIKTLARRRAGYNSLSQRSQAQSAPVIAAVTSSARELGGMFRNG